MAQTERFHVVRNAAINPLEVSFAVRKMSGQRITRIERSGLDVKLHWEPLQTKTRSQTGDLHRADALNQPPISKPYSTFSTWEG